VGSLIAWTTVLVSATAGAYVLYRILRSNPNRLICNILVAVIFVLFTVPAPVPNHTDQLAPAFVVCIFEAFFQIEGTPAVSLRILLLALAVTAAVAGLAHYLLTGRSNRSGAS